MENWLFRFLMSRTVYTFGDLSTYNLIKNSKLQIPCESFKGEKNVWIQNYKSLSMSEFSRRKKMYLLQRTKFYVSSLWRFNKEDCKKTFYQKCFIKTLFVEISQFLSKGQLISKANFLVLICTKKWTKLFFWFLP